MSFLKSTLVAAAFVAATAVAPFEAWAQTTSSSSSSGSSTSEGINTGIPNPYRFIGSTNVTSSSRPVNLNPTGANFSDCEQNLMLQFPIVASGFANGDHIEVWAGTVDCTQDVARSGLTTSGAQLCWQVAASTGSINNTLVTSFNVYVRDVLRFEGASTITTSAVDRLTYNPNWAASDQGETACHVQSADAAVPINIYFIPIASTGLASGGGWYKWTLNSDLVAPPAPTNVTVGPEDTAVQVNWTSPGSADPNLAGFIVWSDPPSGGIVGGGGCSCGSVGAGSASSYVGDGSVPEAASATTQMYDCDGTFYPVPGASSSSGSSASSASGSSSGSSGASSSSGSSASSASGSSSGSSGASSGDDESGASDGAIEEPGSESGDDGPAEGSSGSYSASGSSSGSSSASGSSSGSSSASGSSTSSTGSSSGASNPYSGCTLGRVPIDAGASNCYSPNLSAGFGVSGTSDSTITSTGDDGSTDDASSTASTVVTTVSSTTASASGLPGISEIPPQFNAGEIDSITTTQVTLGGLTNGVIYDIVVTSIDGSGNVGPASLPACGIPAAVTDFYKT